jgi:hypothetical protein
MVSWTMSRMLSTSPSVLLTMDKGGCVSGCAAVVLEELDPQVLVGGECSCVVCATSLFTFVSLKLMMGIHLPVQVPVKVPELTSHAVAVGGLGTLWEVDAKRKIKGRT